MKAKEFLAACVAFSFCLHANAQKSNSDYIDEIKSAGYSVVQPISFALTKQKVAWTMLRKNKDDKNGLLHTAGISADKDGSKIYFKVSRPCVPTEANRLHERIIMIGFQKIETIYVCRQSVDNSGNNEVYLIKSIAGNDFAKNAFLGAEYVFVYLNGLPVPFHTEGFSKDLEGFGGKAL